MNQKKFIIFSTIALFLLMFLTHNLYEWFPSFLTSLFFPVNESVMEHMKMIYFTYLIFTILLFFIKRKNINNYILSFLTTSIFNIILFLIFYLLLYHIFGEIMIVTFILLFLSIFISSFLSYRILTSKKDESLNLIALIIALVIASDFMYFTYNPYKESLWYDPQDKIYGIK